MQPAVLINNLSFSYQETPVLRNISFTIQEGRFVGMIGPNGGGKTTLLKLILGFLHSNQGKIEVFGKSPADARNRMAYVPQSLRFDKEFPLSTLELVLQGRLSHLPWYGSFKRKDNEMALEALNLVGLSDLKNRPFGSLSGGQAQRALVARALASEPRLLILDEPTANVDSQAEAEIYGILKKLQGEITILMVTHNLQAAVELVDDVICVQNTAFSVDPQRLCEHYALGLYHAPIEPIQYL